MAHVNTGKHRLVGNFWSELHTPQVTAELGVHLADDVQEDAVVVLLDGAVSHELGNNWRVAIDFVFQERVEVLVVRLVRHDNQENEL